MQPSTQKRDWAVVAFPFVPADHGRSSLKKMRHNRLLLGRVATTVFVVIVAWSLFVLYSVARHDLAQRNWSHTSDGTNSSGAFPSVASHTITDSKGTPRIVMLHKLTKPLPATAPNCFSWLDLIAMDPRDNRLECTIDGKTVTLDPDELQVFFVVDDGAPSKLTHSNANVPIFASAESVWDNYVQPYTEPMP